MAIKTRYYKLGNLKPNTYFLIILKATSLNSICHWGWFILSPHFWSAHAHLLSGTSHGLNVSLLTSKEDLIHIRVYCINLSLAWLPLEGSCFYLQSHSEVLKTLACECWRGITHPLKFTFLRHLRCY